MKKVWILTKTYTSDGDLCDSSSDIIGVFEDRKEGEKELDKVNQEFLDNDFPHYGKELRDHIKVMEENGNYEEINDEKSKSIFYSLAYSESFLLCLKEYDITPKQK